MKSHRFVRQIGEADFARASGRVRKVAPGRIEATGPAAPLGELCEIECAAAGFEGRPRTVVAEVAAVDDTSVVLIPLGGEEGVQVDARVRAPLVRDRVPVGNGFAGRAVDALGRPLDGGPPIAADAHLPLGGAVMRPMERTSPKRTVATGIRAIDGLLTLGVGQRIGIFAASGVGKTSLMEQLAEQIESDRTLLCLVGERGREVESIWRRLGGRQDRERFTIVASTSDESAALRARAVRYALCLADFWRARGEHVVLMVDSVTRLAMALREIGLAAGAPPTVRAYTPNVFAELPRVVERCGASRRGGSITAIMTVLSETDDLDDPIVELMKSLLDGHILLSRTLADQGHFPAIDAARSVSRGAEKLVPAQQAAAMRTLTGMLAAYEESRVMIESGVYKNGTNALVDKAIASRDRINAFLRQRHDDNADPAETVRALLALAAGGGADA
jgi:flagellum-specific ATP synthase